MSVSAYKILASDRLLRRAKLPPYVTNAIEYVKTLPDGSKKISRLTFKPNREKDKDGLSVSIVELATSISVLYNRNTHLAVTVRSEQCTNLGLITEHNPLCDKTEDPLYAHALIKGLDERKDLQATLADACRIVE